MRYIFVDFEMNPVSKKFSEVRKICGREIIEIGAVMLNENLEEIDQFKVFVKPEFNSSICKKYEELTGISTNMVASATPFSKAYMEFVAWCGSEDYEIYAWSDNDKIQIEREMLLKNYEKDSEIEYMFEHWIDFQKIFSEIIQSKRVLSLEKALNVCGITFLGQKHDALCDARNTSLLYKESKQNDILKFTQNIKSYLGVESEPIRLGDIFNFYSLDFQFT